MSITRPIGRAARPGDLEGPLDPPWRACRRCGLNCGREGHPYGCPRHPDYHAVASLAIRPCYCGQTMVAAPAWLGPCCAGTPPVKLPTACVGCGSDLCRVCDWEDEPEDQYGDWEHARCADERLRFDPEYVTRRQAKRQVLGVVDAR